MKVKLLILLLMMSFCVNEANFMPVEAASTTKTVTVPPKGGWVIHGVYTKSGNSNRVYATNYIKPGTYNYCDAVCTSDALGTWCVCSNSTYRLYRDNVRKTINLINTIDDGKHISIRLQGLLNQTCNDNHTITFEY